MFFYTCIIYIASILASIRSTALALELLALQMWFTNCYPDIYSFGITIKNWYTQGIIQAHNALLVLFCKLQLNDSLFSWIPQYCSWDEACHSDEVCPRGEYYHIYRGEDCSKGKDWPRYEDYLRDEACHIGKDCLTVEHYPIAQHYVYMP